MRFMTASKDGDVYLMDHFDLKKVGKDGTLKTIASHIEEWNGGLDMWMQRNDPHLVMGICLDHDGNIYAAVPGGRVIKKLTTNGEVAIVARIKAPWFPSGILVGSNGSLYVLEYTIADIFNARVERIDPDGKRKVY